MSDEKKEITNIQRFEAVMELLDRLENLGYPQRIKLIHSKYNDGLINCEEFSDLIGLTISDKEDGKIKHGDKRDKVDEKRKNEKIVISYVCYREAYGYTYEKTINLLSEKYNMANSTIKRYVTKNKNIIDKLNKYNNDPDYVREIKKNHVTHKKRLNLMSIEEFENKLNKEKNLVKLLTQKPVDVSQLISKAFAEGLRHVSEHSKSNTKKKSKIKK